MSLYVGLAVGETGQASGTAFRFRVVFLVAFFFLGFLFGFELLAGGADAGEEFGGRFVARVLRDQLASERFGEDGLVQLR